MSEPRAKMEDFWRLRLEEVAEHHRLVQAHFQKTLDEFSGGLTVPPDGSLSIRKARIEESAARDKHMRILQIFTDLILYGKIPEEDTDYAP